MKKFIKGFLIFIVVCALIGVLIGYLLSGLPVLTMGGRAFLMAVANEQYEQAYVMLTPDFQARNDLGTFKSNIKATGLDQYKEVIWLKDETYPEQRSGVVIGRVITKGNQQMLVEFQFALVTGKEWNQKAWLINNIRFPTEESLQ